MARVLLGVTGSIAAVKTLPLVRALRADGHEVKVAPSRAALAFFDPAELPSASEEPAGALRVREQGTLYLDSDEWPSDRLFQVGEPVLHIELRRWAEVLLIAPLDANTLAKLAVGLCDTLLTCVYRAWEPSRPVILAPAMNTLMWEHPATARHLRQLLEDHGGAETPATRDPDAIAAAINATCSALRIAGPQSKRLACGDVGVGGMADVDALAAAVLEFTTEAQRH